jgi:hypothetical protein
MNTFFQQKYNKYKNKYLILKKLLNQKGSGIPPYKVLVIGGGDPGLYGQGFFEVGGHPTSNFGAGQDWTHPQFWTDLETKLGDLKFEIIILDKGSTSWLQKEMFDLFLRTSMKFLVPEGIFLLEGPFAHNDNTVEIHDTIKEHRLNIIGRIGFGKVMDNNIYTIYSPNRGGLLIDRKDINISDINIGDITPGTWNLMGYININRDFKYVTEEQNQIEFIKKRFIKM